MKWTMPLGVVLLSAAAIGCGSEGVFIPAKSASSVNASIQAAEQAGAASTPQAAHHLKLAHEGLAASKRALAVNDVVGTNLYLLRADSDARLAGAIARDGAVRAQASEAMADVVRLQGQTPGQGPEQGQGQTTP